MFHTYTPNHVPIKYQHSTPNDFWDTATQGFSHWSPFPLWYKNGTSTNIKVPINRISTFLDKTHFYWSHFWIRQKDSCMATGIYKHIRHTGRELMQRATHKSEDLIKRFKWINDQTFVIINIYIYYENICKTIYKILLSKTILSKAKRCFCPLAWAQSHQRHEKCTRIYESLGTQRNSNSDTSQSWSRTQTVTHPSINVAHCCLTSVSRQILITLRHNSWKSGDKKKKKRRSVSSIEARA